MPQISEDPQKHLVLIDGYGFVFRAYHALSRTNLKRKDGTPVGAVMAFTNMITKIIKDHHCDYIAVILDAGKNTFRNEIYTEYKAHRPPCPEDLVPQFPIIREAVDAMNISVAEMVGYEADDLIATYAKQAAAKGCRVTVISSDKDLMQLIGGDIYMYDAMKSKLIGEEQVREKFGIEPEKMLDLLSLMGDSADNIPGVPGIGPKTAAELINRFGSLDEILDRAGEVKQNKRRETLIENRDKAILSRDLVRLCEDVPVVEPFENFTSRKIDDEVYLKFLLAQNFKTMAAKLQSANPELAAVSAEFSEAEEPQEQAPQKKLTKTLVEDRNALIKWLASLGELKEFAIAPLYSKKNVALGVSLACDDGVCAYIPFGVKQAPKQTNMFGDDTEESGLESLDLLQILTYLKKILTDKSIVKVVHDVKHILKIAGEINSFDDVMVASYLLGAGRYKHDFSSVVEESKLLPSFKHIYEVEESEALDLACDTSFVLLSIMQNLRTKMVAEKCYSLYEKLDKKLVVVAATMEQNGVKLDCQHLKNLSADFAAEMQKSEQKIYELAECEFNIGSPKQLGEILFDKMGYKGGKKSKKTGAYSTDVKVLQELADSNCEIATAVLNWRHFSKIKSTYSDALPKQVEQDGRVRTHYALAATSTGRLSSSDPNLQNIPVRSTEGNKIREAFVAKAGYKLMSADYSQIELRLLAEMADIAPLKEAFKNGLDIHAATASQMFGVDVSDVSSDMRRNAKMINFGIIYGISAFGLAQRLGIGRTQAADYIKQYFVQYPGIQKYMDSTVEFAKEHGYVETIWGRKCYVNGINDKNGAVRQFSERAAINAPLQGTAADIIRKAMVDVQDYLITSGVKSQMLLQVHDELIIEVPENEVDIVPEKIKKIMANAMQISVPLTVDYGVGNNWSEIH